jgi:hypothetical protein
VCVCVCVRVFVCELQYVCVLGGRIRVCECACACARACACITCACSQVNLRAYTCVHACMHTRVYECVRTCIHTHRCARTCMPDPPIRTTLPITILTHKPPPPPHMTTSILIHPRTHNILTNRRRALFGHSCFCLRSAVCTFHIRAAQKHRHRRMRSIQPAHPTRTRACRAQ